MFGLGLILIQQKAIFLNNIYKFFFVMEIMCFLWGRNKFLSINLLNVGIQIKID